MTELTPKLCFWNTFVMAKMSRRKSHQMKWATYWWWYCHHVVAWFTDII